MWFFVVFILIGFGVLLKYGGCCFFMSSEKFLVFICSNITPLLLPTPSSSSVTPIKQRSGLFFTMSYIYTCVYLTLFIVCSILLSLHILDILNNLLPSSLILPTAVSNLLLNSPIEVFASVITSFDF